MGTLIVPPGGVVYLDANSVIYTVEKHPIFGPLLTPLWQALQAGTVEAVTSELTLMEALVSPIKHGDAALQAAYEQALLAADLRLIPITLAVVREAARLRATTKLKTPDAIHAATATLAGCALFVTNDVGLRGVGGLPLVVLSDLLGP